jgi:nicotinamide-nucleotide amidase
MNAAIISIGDELIIGQVVNTNASYLSKAFFSAGIPVEKVITVPDDEKLILKQFHDAFRSADIIAVTGGLGPTHDDITTHCIAKFFKSKLVLDKNLLKSIKARFKKRKIKLPETSYRQALVPDIAEILSNKAGTAPGILVRKNGKIFFAMPGVPAEMVYLTEKHLLPVIKKQFKGGRTLKEKTLHTIGISESLLSQKIGNLNDILKESGGVIVKLAFLPASFEVRLRITVEAKSPALADKEILSTVKKLKARIGNYIYSYEEKSIEEVTGSILAERKMKIAAAESCTGGLVSSKITNVAGSSEYFMDGIVAYTNEAKIEFLGVKKKTIDTYGAVSKETAIEMAEGARKRLGADIGVSTTGIAGPGGGTKTKPIGLVWIGYSDKKNSFAKEFIFTKDRLRNKEVMSKMALEIVRRKLLRIE